MFYRTQIKSVTDFGVVDMAGKKLRFMGYLPVKAGDWGFTDGTFIFGNVPPRGSPATFGEDPPGVPVLGDDLRGYFSRNGNFKNYPVKQDTWLVNSDKKFTHGSEDNFIDAELADDGSLLTVEKNPVQILDNDITSDILFYYYLRSHESIFYIGIDYYSMMYLESRTRGVRVSMSEYQSWWLFHGLDDTGDFDYYRNALPEVQQTDFDSERNLIPPTFTPQDKLIKDCEIIIKKDGEEFEIVNLSDLVKTAEELAMDSITIPNMKVSDDSTAMKSRAALKNFKIMPDASWQALFLIEIGAENYWNLKTDFPERGTYEGLNFATSAGHFLFLFKVDSTGNYTKLADRSFFMPFWMVNNIRYKAITARGPVHPASEPAIIIPPFVINPTTFPYEAWNMDTLGWHWVDAWGKPPTGYDWYEFTLCTVYDSRLMDGAPEYNKDIYNINSEFYFPVQDNFRANFINTQDDVDKWTLGGIVDAQNKEIIGSFLPDQTDAHTWNMACASLKGGSCLFGIHDRALYKIDPYGNSELVGDNLKNFRLRELKKISKSRR